MYEWIRIADKEIIIIVIVIIIIIIIINNDDDDDIFGLFVTKTYTVNSFSNPYIPVYNIIIDKLVFYSMNNHTVRRIRLRTHFV